MPLLFKPYHMMTAEDYAAIGFRCGLEVHRQLRSRTKLFCRCPAGQYSDEYDAEILRHMRPTLSELGEYDGTALMEKKTRKNIYYRVHHATVCTYEFDDTPPFFIAEDALDAGIRMALLLRLNMVGELHIARKQYLDGSIPTGFQRTTILGVDGWIPCHGRRIGVLQLGLEEDACREVSDIGHDRSYLTDRLGMPLIEIVTGPDMRTPQEVADVARVIRKLCRSTGDVRTGYGAVRQDVNVSVTGGTRVEIKGVPQIWRIPRLVYNEARRQCALLSIRDELRRRAAEAETFRHHSEDVTRTIAKTRYGPMQGAVAEGLRVKAVVLDRFAGLLNEPTQEHTTFAKEFSDRIRVIACLTELPNMVHSDAASESLYGPDWLRLRKRLKANAKDALILVWGNDADTDTACQEIINRACEAAEGVPSDTRQALKDGTTGFERVLPGADRMYPDTDLPPLPIPEQRIETLRVGLPEYVWDREDRYREMGLREELVEALVVSPRADLFDRLVGELGVGGTLAVVVLCQQERANRRRGLRPDSLTDDEVEEIFRAHVQGKLAREGIARVIRSVLERRIRETKTRTSVQDVMAELDVGPRTPQQVGARIGEAVRDLDHDRFPDTDRKHRFLMGVLMKQLLGRVSGREVAEGLMKALDPDGCCARPAEV